MSEQSVTDFRNRARAWLAENAPRRGADDESAARADLSLLAGVAAA